MIKLNDNFRFYIFRRFIITSWWDYSTVLGGEGSQGSVARPRSARVAQAALAGVAPPPPPDAMQLRRALASKLKTEVVDITN